MFFAGWYALLDKRDESHRAVFTSRHMRVFPPCRIRFGIAGDFAQPFFTDVFVHSIWANKHIFVSALMREFL
jgi:hypothetical protein